MDQFNTDKLIVSHDKVETTNKNGINYQKVVQQFGCQLIDSNLLQKIKTVTKQDKLHPFLEKNIFFAHRDLDKLMDICLKTETNDFYIYTGRGPSSANLHLGHLVPFMATKYLQDIFDVPVVIQITDDEKYYNKDGIQLNTFKEYALENIKDIIACGFNPHKTFIFLNSQITSLYNHNIIKIQKKINLNHIKSTFGFNEDDNMGRISFPVHQMVPAFASSFPGVLDNNPKQDISTYLFDHSEISKQLTQKRCLIVAAVDQDPYFRLVRDIASKLNEHKPILIYSKFLGSLQGKHTKMSASIDNSSVFLTDTPKQIKKKINSHAFSGGQETAELHRELGGNPDIDVAFQYIKFFSTDYKMIDKIYKDYTSGELLTGHIKKICIDILTQIVTQHQEAKKNINKEILIKFLTIRCIN
jgi:tryptophanyl-tRNA synthetase